MTNGRAGTAGADPGMHAGGVAVRRIPSDPSGTSGEPPAAAGEAPLQFRLVRLRLALALLAAASIPIAIAIIVPTLLGSGRVDQTQAVQAGSQVSAGVAAELERSRSALLLLAANPSTVRLAMGAGSAGDARTDLQSISAVVGARVLVAAVVDAAGVERLRLEDERVVPPQTDPVDASLLHATLALDAGEMYRSEPFVGPAGPSRIAIAAPLMNAGKAVGLVRLDLSLAGLLTAPQADIAARGGYALIVDTATGDVVADGRSQSGASGASQPGSSAPPGLPDPDQLLARLVSQAGQTWTSLLSGNWSVDYAPLDTAVPGFGGWAVVVALPATPSAPPVALLAALALLILLLAVLALWMAHEVLQPAAELDRSHRELSQQFEVARHDALHDNLTGLGNHRAFHEELDRQMEVSRRYGVPVALLLLDLDDFKHVNDSAGHAAGDAVLASVGDFLNGHIRATDRAFRIGGDEFAVVMPHTDMDGGMVGARRMLGMALEPVATSALRKPVSFSAGVSAIPAPAESRAELYAQADAALMWCKRHGRTSVAAFDPTRHPLDSVDAMATLSQTVAAVAAHRALRPVFQPVVELETGRVIGFEGLIRPATGSGFADPGSMFVAAEKCGRTVELDQACLEVIAAAATAIPVDRSISLNLSPRSLEAPEFSANALTRTLERLGLSPSRVVIELTEREVVDDMELLTANLQAVRRAGMRIAADDVGSGNAGLRLLSQIHFDIVKIDLSLVQGGMASESSLAVLRSLIDLTKQWDALVVAEGVETPDQLRALRGLDVSAAQGYLLGRPSDDVHIGSVDLDALMARTMTIPGWAAVSATPA